MGDKAATHSKVDEGAVDIKDDWMQPPPPEAYGDDDPIVGERYPDWRRSAILTMFLFPPFGIPAMILACRGYKNGSNGDVESARCQGRFTCALIFLSLLFCVGMVLSLILLRIYDIIQTPF